MFCPHCEKLNKCCCSNCNPSNETEGVLICDKDSEGYRCFYCGELFQEGDSIDFEWNRMMNRFKEEISPEICLDWWESKNLPLLLLSGKNQNISQSQKLESEFGSFGIESAFRLHFGLDPYKVSYVKYMQLKREVTINKII